MKRTLLTIIALILMITGCGKSPSNSSDRNGIADVTVEVYTNTDYGIQCIKPLSWTEDQSGKFRISAPGSGWAEYQIGFFPQMDTDWLISDYFSEKYPEAALATTDDKSIETAYLTWQTFTFNSDYRTSARTVIGHARSATGVYFIELAADRDHFNALYDKLFSPALTEFQPISLVDPEFSISEGRQLFDYDDSVPLDIVVEETNQFTDYTAIRLHYQSPKGGVVPGSLLIPNGTGPFPAIILMHPTPGGREGILGLAEAYVLAGNIALAIDAPYARPENAGRSFSTYTITDYEEQIQLMVDLRRGVDLLEQRTDVDPDRMVYIGASYGGGMGGLLAGIENRLKAYVLMVGGSGLVSHLNHSDEDWNALMWPIEPVHFLRYVTPAKLLFQNGLNDSAVPVAEAVRAQIAGSDPKTIMWYPTDHWLNPQAYVDQMNWLNTEVGINTE
jgi:uncharacterized protein